MEWHPTNAQSLAVIDQEIGKHHFSPAEYEIIRRVIYETGDFDYQSLITFSDRSLQAGAAALAARTTIVVDVPMVQVGIAANIQKTFANPVYCALETITRPQKKKPQVAWGIHTLAQRYPEGIFVIGQAQTALSILVELIESEQIRPALIIATPAGFVDVNNAQERLKESMIPNIRLNGRKGNAVVAVAILNSLLELAWEAYGKNSKE